MQTCRCRHASASALPYWVHSLNCAVTASISTRTPQKIALVQVDCRHPGSQWKLLVLGQTQIITPSLGSATANHSLACGNTLKRRRWRWIGHALINIQTPLAECPSTGDTWGQAQKSTGKDNRVQQGRCHAPAAPSQLKLRPLLISCWLPGTMGFSISLQVIGQLTLAWSELQINQC